MSRPADQSRTTDAHKAWLSLRPEDVHAPTWDAVFTSLDRLYATPIRAYHNLDHVLATLDALDRICEGNAPAAATLALWFHDGVYVPGAPNNEQASAELCLAYAPTLGFDEETVGEAYHAILATQPDAPDTNASPTTEIGEMVVDADLSILGASPDEYDAYTSSIRREWAHVPDEAFRSGRKAVMEGIAARPRLFTTARAFELFEEMARANLAREIGSLFVRGQRS